MTVSVYDNATLQSYVGKVSYKDFSDTLVNLSSGIDRQEAQQLASLLDRRKVGGIEYKNILKSLREIQSKEMMIVPTAAGSSGSGNSNNRNQENQRRRGDDDYDVNDDRSNNDRYGNHHDDDRRRDHRDINNYNRKEYGHIDDRMGSNGNYHRRDDDVEYRGGSYSDNYNRKDNDKNSNSNNNVLDNHKVNSTAEYNNYSSFYSDSKGDADRPVRHTNKDTSRISTNSISSRSSPQRSASPSLLPSSSLSSPGRRRQYAHNATTITPSAADIDSSDVEASTLNYFTTTDIIHVDSHVLDPHYKPPHIQASLITVPTRHMNNPDINRTPLFTDYYHSIYRYPYHIDKTTDEVKRERGRGRSSSAPTLNNHYSLDSFLQSISDGDRIQRRPYKYSLKAKLLQQSSVDDDNDDGVHRDGDIDSRVTPTTTMSPTANATATTSRISPTHRRVRRTNPITDPFQTSADNTILDLNPLYKIHAKRNVDNHSSFHHRIDPQILGT